MQHLYDFLLPSEHPFRIPGRRVIMSKEVERTMDEDAREFSTERLARARRLLTDVRGTDDEFAKIPTPSRSPSSPLEGEKTMASCALLVAVGCGLWA